MASSDILLGVVTGALGLKGEVKVKTFTSTPEAIANYGELHTKDGRRLKVARAKTGKGDEALVVLTGISDRSAADALKGAELFVSRGALPAIDEGEYYHADLIGLAAHDGEDRRIGTVKAIHNYGAGDIVEIETPDGGDILLAFTRETVPHIDIANGYLTIAVPEELEDAQHPGVE